MISNNISLKIVNFSFSRNSLKTLLENLSPSKILREPKGLLNLIDFIIARGGRESPCVSYRDRDVLSNNSGTFNDNNTTSNGRKVCSPIVGGLDAGPVLCLYILGETGRGVPT